MVLWKALDKTDWVYPTTVLCVFGFFISMKPGEPFLTPYLIGPTKNFTIGQVLNELYPIWTYSILALLCPVLLLTDIVLYKPTIIVQAVSCIIIATLLCFSQGIPAMQFLQFNLGLDTATEVAYYAYIYSIVDADHYQKVTSYLRSITLLSYMLGALLGQLLVSLWMVPYFYLFAVTLGSSSIAFITSLFLPMPKQSLFESETSFEEENHDGRKTSHKISKWRPFKILRQMWRDFKMCYSTKVMIYWSLWWALATCGYNQVFNYIQILWDRLETSESSVVYNGGVEAAAALSGALVTFVVGYVKLDWSIWGELALSFFSAVSCASLFAMDISRSIWISYASYVIFKSSYMLLITIAMFQIASNLSIARYALVFGINTFVAVLFQTILTLIVVDSKGLGLDIVKQFFIYAMLHVIITLLFLVRGIYSALLGKKILKSTNLSTEKITKH